MARGATDLRKGFDGLSAIVCDQLDQDPQSGHLFLFVNKRKNRLKLLLWDGTGLWQFYKRLENGRFQIFDQASQHDHCFEMRRSDLHLLLEGIDLRCARRRESLDELKRKGA